MSNALSQQLQKYYASGAIICARLWQLECSKHSYKISRVNRGVNHRLVWTVFVIFTKFIMQFISGMRTRFAQITYHYCCLRFQSTWFENLATKSALNRRPDQTRFQWKFLNKGDRMIRIGGRRNWPGDNVKRGEWMHQTLTFKDMSIEAVAYTIFNLQEYVSIGGEFIGRLNGPLAVPHMLIAQ